MKSFFEFIRRFGTVPPHDEAVLRRYAKRAQLSAGDFFLKPGQICHQVGFLFKGVLRVYVQSEEGREISRGFPAEDHFMVDLDSFNGKKISIEFWEAMTDIEFVYWERSDLDRMEGEITCWQAILIPMTQHILVSAAHERNEMFSDDATTRYTKFLARHPQIVARVPLRHVASYLGIAPQSLSRIRQQLLKG